VPNLTNSFKKAALSPPSGPSKQSSLNRTFQLVNHSIFNILVLFLCLSVRAVADNHSAAKDIRTSDSDLTNVPVPKTNDPWQRLNRTTFRFNDGLTTYALRPVAHGYAAIVPVRVRTGLTNFFDNLNYPVRFINSVLQGKITRSAQETEKFVVNSTAGVGGLIRVSDHIQVSRMSRRKNLGQTLGVWGYLSRALPCHPGPWPPRIAVILVGFRRRPMP